MEELAHHDVKYGRHRVRRSYARISEVLELPNLIEIQTDSYQWFLDEGIREMFKDIKLKIYCPIIFATTAALKQPMIIFLVTFL